MATMAVQGGWGTPNPSSEPTGSYEAHLHGLAGHFVYLANEEFQKQVRDMFEEMHRLREELLKALELLQAHTKREQELHDAFEGMHIHAQALAKMHEAADPTVQAIQAVPLSMIDGHNTNRQKLREPAEDARRELERIGAFLTSLPEIPTSGVPTPYHYRVNKQTGARPWPQGPSRPLSPRNDPWRGSQPSSPASWRKPEAPPSSRPAPSAWSPGTVDTFSQPPPMFANNNLNDTVQLSRRDLEEVLAGAVEKAVGQELARRPDAFSRRPPDELDGSSVSPRQQEQPAQRSRTPTVASSYGTAEPTAPKPQQSSGGQQQGAGAPTPPPPISVMSPNVAAPSAANTMRYEPTAFTPPYASPMSPMSPQHQQMLSPTHVRPGMVPHQGPLPGSAAYGQSPYPVVHSHTGAPVSPRQQAPGSRMF